MKYIPKFQRPNGPLPQKESQYYKPGPIFNQPAPSKLDFSGYLIKPRSTTSYLDIAIPVIKEYEKFKPSVYKDANGIPTIGYGLTEQKYIDKKTITEPEALEALTQYINTNIDPYLQKKSYYNKLNDNQKGALTSLIYNIGITKFNNSPNLQKALTAGNWKLAASEMNHGWYDIKNPGLKDRRIFEQNLFLKNI